MEDKISFEREGLSARFTGERPIPGMAPRHMVYQMLLLEKRNKHYLKLPLSDILTPINYLSCKWLIADIAAMRIIA